MGSGLSCFQINQQHKIHNLNQLSVHHDHKSRQVQDDRTANSRSPANGKHSKRHRDHSQVAITRQPTQRKFKYGNKLTLPSVLRSTRSISSNISSLSPCSVISAAPTAISQLSGSSPTNSSSSDREIEHSHEYLHEQDDDQSIDSHSHSSSETSVSLTIDRNETSVSSQSSSSYNECDGYSPIEPTLDTTECDANIKILSPTTQYNSAFHVIQDDDDDENVSSADEYYNESDTDINDENTMPNAKTQLQYAVNSKDDLILTEKRESYLSQISALSEVSSKLSTLPQDGEANAKAFGLSRKLSQLLKRKKSSKNDGHGNELFSVQSRSKIFELEEQDEETTDSATSSEEYQIYGDVEYKHVNVSQLAMCLREDEDEYYYEDDSESSAYVD